MSDLTASFHRAEAAYLEPPEWSDSQVQIQGCLEFSSLLDMDLFDTGELENIAIIDAGFDPETNTVKIWISGWLDCDEHGEYTHDKTGELSSVEVVDTQNVDFGPDPDYAHDNHEEF